MPSRLRREEVVTIEVLAEKGTAGREIARTLGVTEGSVRYHLRRRAEGATDGRAKPFAAESFAGAIGAWVEAHARGQRPVNTRELHEHLVAEHGYEHSYKSVLRFVRARYPRPRVRTYRRVETPPGAQSQTDWGEFPRVDVGEGPEPLHAFLMTLSCSRKTAVVWSRREDQLHWLSCHNGAFRRLEGVAAVNRIDNVKTAVASGAGAWGEIHETYRSYARAVGFHIDACPPREAWAKGKVEAKVRLLRLRADPQGQRFRGIEELQAWTDERMEAWSRKAVCPATGRSVEESWKAEKERLAALPVLPEPFDVVVTRTVAKDCTVAFEGRSYAVPFEHALREVEVHGCAGRVQVLAGGRVVREYPRGTAERVLIDPTCYEGEATERVLPPPPLGRMSARLQAILETPVATRPLDLYAALMEVAR
jgi:transposase